MNLVEAMVASAMLVSSSSCSLQLWAGSTSWTRQAEGRQQQLAQLDAALLSSQSQLVALAGAAGQLAAGELEGQTGQVGSVAYRLVAWEGPRWLEPAGVDGLQRSQAVATLELLPTPEQPRPLRAAFGLELAQPVGPAAGGVRVLALKELGLRGRSAQGVAP